jgi:hypothetical protein
MPFILVAVLPWAHVDGANRYLAKLSRSDYVSIPLMAVRTADRRGV